MGLRDEKKYELHVHGNPTFTNNDRFIAQGNVSFLGQVSDLQRKVVSSRFVSPVQGEWEEETLESIIRRAEERDTSHTRATPWTLAVNFP